MYVVEGGEGMFTSIPKSIYWAIVTFTTVGYGDITPTTPFGQAIATIIMILGYSVIVVPSAFIGAEMVGGNQPENLCPKCKKNK